MRWRHARQQCWRQMWRSSERASDVELPEGGEKDAVVVRLSQKEVARVGVLSTGRGRGRGPPES